MRAERLRFRPAHGADRSSTLGGRGGRTARCRSGRGQALVESLVFVLAAGAILLGLRWLGQLMDARGAAISTSRLVAFECTVRVHGCRDGARPTTPAADFLAREAGPVRSMPAAAPIARWADRGGRVLVADATPDLSVSAPSFDASRALLDRFGAGGLDGAWKAADRVAGPAAFGLDMQDGLRTVQAGIRVRPDVAGTPGVRLPGIGADGVLLQARTTVLTDGWEASGPEAGARPVRSLVEAGWTSDVVEAGTNAGYLLARALIASAGWLGIEPAADRYRHHRIDMDVVPADRRPR